ncbi:MAG: hypothetical protein GQ569_10145 [Methylococcaceae bacterium]|nr:hypothetical protein [Methylococcaceae bacterium]
MNIKTLTILADTTENNKKPIHPSHWFWRILSSLILIATFSTTSYAHRGAPDQIDACRIKVGYEKIHFTAYTPKFSKNQGYCQFIPNVGVTSLVFDYEGKKLRDVSIEFEVTKEPEGTRVFYQAPKKIKTGTVNGTVDFAKFGEGDYLAHVTIVHNGEKLDSHLPFAVGVSEPQSHWALYLFAGLVLALVVFFTKLTRANKKEVENNDNEPVE